MSGGPSRPAASSPPAALRRLGRIRDRYSAEFSREKLGLLRRLASSRLPRSAALLRLHEILCFLRAYPDDAAMLRQVERMLSAFPRRADLRRHREALTDTGVAGAGIRFRFFYPTAIWLERRWPGRLRIEWERLTSRSRVESLLPLLVHYAETPGLDEWDFSLREWIGRLKGPRESDAGFLIRRLAALKADSFTREKIYDDLDLPLRLPAGADTPSRSRARHPRSPVIFVRGSLSRRRPVLPGDARRSPKAIRAVSPREAGALIDLAREAMITRQRDLDVFSWASPRDVRLVEWEDGLQFACLGAVPERRLLLEAVYGFLTLKNGIPVGYVLASALLGSSEIAYNVFETFRGSEAGFIYGRVMSTVRHLFGSDAFTIFPYQLGHGNEEAIRSGAWWFYQKVGFRPRDGEARRLMRRELSRMRRNPAHRSDPATLRSLAAHNLYYFLGPERRPIIGDDLIPDLGLKVSRYLARRFGADRERAEETCAKEAAGRLGLPGTRGFSAGERLAWSRWAPLVLLLPGVERWPAGAKTDLVEVIRAKGGRRESDFVLRFDAHARLRRALIALGRDGRRR